MFYIGQKVVAIKSHSEGAFKKGDEFIVKDVKESGCKCSRHLIDVGIKTNALFSNCPTCDYRYFKDDGIHWFASILFAPIETYRESYSIAIELVQQMEQVDKQKIFNPKKSRNMKLIKGKKYVITGASDIKPDFVKKCEVKFPQTVLFDGEWLIVKDIDGFSGWAKEIFILKETRQATLEIYKTKRGLSYRKIASNGKVLNHQYNSLAGLKKGIEAEKRFWSNYKIVKK